MECVKEFKERFWVHKKRVKQKKFRLMDNQAENNEKSTA